MGLFNFWKKKKVQEPTSTEKVNELRNKVNNGEINLSKEENNFGETKERKFNDTICEICNNVIGQDKYTIKQSKTYHKKCWKTKMRDITGHS